jgi:ribosomal protein S18 acetylase RimI-like enzyme
MTSYAAHVLPQKGDNLSLHADKYSELRTTALRQSPKEFSGTIEDEQAMTKEQRIDRLLQSNRKVVIVAVQSGETDWIDEEWVGSSVILGPMTKEAYFKPFTIHKQEEIPSTLLEQRFTFSSEDQRSIKGRDPRGYYHMTALFVDENHRRRGIANILCERSFHLAIDESKQADMRIFVAPDNVKVLKMYDRLGFKTVKETCTYSEARVASKDPLPVDFDTNSKLNSRGGIIMVKHLG